jgi:hypothetical protein
MWPLSIKKWQFRFVIKLCLSNIDSKPIYLMWRHEQYHHADKEVHSVCYSFFGLLCRDMKSPCLITVSDFSVIRLLFFRFIVSRYEVSLSNYSIRFQNDLYLYFEVVLHSSVNFSFFKYSSLCSNIPLSPAYGVYVSLLIRYERVCFAYEDFSKRGRLLTNKLMLQGYNGSRLKSPFCKFCGRYNDLVCDCKLPLAHMVDDLFHTIC